MNFGGIPVLGLDTSGSLLNLIPSRDSNNNGSAITSGYAENLGASNSAWELTQVTSIGRSNSGDLVCLGYGSTKDGGTENLCWVRKSGSWIIGNSDVNSVGSKSVAHDGTNYVAVSSVTIKSGLFDLSNTSPAGGFATGLPTWSSEVSANADSVISSNSKAIVYSLSTVGLWTGPTFTHLLGIPVAVETGHYETSYTFPGASGSSLQTQIVKAIPPADTVPTTWGDNSETSEGYYGVMNQPHFTISWPATTV